MKASLCLAWIRREMRLHDNAVLAKAQQVSMCTQPIFIFDPNILKQFSNPRDRRITLLMKTLIRMHHTLQMQQAGMLVLYGDPQAIIPRLSHVLDIDHLVHAEDFEPQCKIRDDSIKKAIAAEVHTVLDHVILHPNQVLTAENLPYRVYSPYAKSWQKQVSSSHFNPYKTPGSYAEYESIIDALRDVDCSIVPLDKGIEAALDFIGYKCTDIMQWKPESAQDRLASFVEHKVSAYKDNRNILYGDHTSHISPYLRFGLLSIREAFRSAWQENQAQTWISELIWREFYHAILYHFPEVVEQDFQEKYRGKLQWSDNDEHLEAWKQGNTGYPVVDAAMRELLQTGWMHNRARMIVASFLTKDLHIDWRVGEAYFAQYLMDYELSSNNGGWQWSASTGADGQPYFRVFNPLLQSKRFDPEGKYIRAYIPQLHDVCNDDIHAPHETLFGPPDYPSPIVDHHEEKKRAIAMFKEVV